MPVKGYSAASYQSIRDLVGHAGDSFSSALRESRPMPTHVMLLVLFGALLHASWNAMVKSGGDKLGETGLIAGGAALVSLFALPFLPLPTAACVPWLIVSVIIHQLYYALVAAAYRAGDMGHTYPLMRGSAPLLVAQRAVAAFKAQGGGGAIVNIGSVNAYAGAYNLTAYSMSKGALMTMTRNLAEALMLDLIRVNQLNLGWILTEMEKETQRKEGRPDGWFLDLPPQTAPIGRLLGPEDVAKHVLFWLSEQSAPVTGQVYEITQTPFLGRG